MIDRLITFSIRWRWLVILLTACFALWGIRAAFRTPVDAIPDLSENQVIVFTEWPGHGPREIEDQVTYPLSLELQGLGGVRVVRSSSDVGFSMISVIFEDRVASRGGRGSVAERLAQVGRDCPPELVPRPGARRRRDRPDLLVHASRAAGSTSAGCGRSRTGTSGRSSRSVPGVAEVASVGGCPFEYQVERRPGPPPGARRSRSAQVAEAVARVERGRRRARRPQGQRRVRRPRRRLARRAAGTTRRRGRSSAHRPRPGKRASLRGRWHGRFHWGKSPGSSLGPAPRRGVLEKDGNEVTGGVVLMRHGENPLEVTRRLAAKIRELQTGLPQGVRIVPVYDRTPLIEGAIGTRHRHAPRGDPDRDHLRPGDPSLHVRTSLHHRHHPSAGGALLVRPGDVLRDRVSPTSRRTSCRWPGIAISIGVLVDSSIVMAENAMHRLKRAIRRCAGLGRHARRSCSRPAGRSAGRSSSRSSSCSCRSCRSSPWAASRGRCSTRWRSPSRSRWLGVAVLAITLVPALCTVFVRGRLRSRGGGPLVRGVIEVYRPVLAYLLDRPVGIVWFLG